MTSKLALTQSNSAMSAVTPRSAVDDGRYFLAAQNTYDNKTSMCNVFGTVSICIRQRFTSITNPQQTELHEMILSYASTKDLTRLLAVSKHWRMSILSSTVLRRKLFLAPESKTEYHSIELPVILGEESATSRSIHEPHPILLPYTNPTTNTYVEVNEIPKRSFSIVHPATFLFQPPLNNIRVYCPGYGIAKLLTRTGGVTFGDVVKELDKLCATRLYWDGWNGDSCTLIHSEALVSNSKVVMDAREARARAQASAGLE